MSEIVSSLKSKPDVLEPINNQRISEVINEAKDRFDELSLNNESTQFLGYSEIYSLNEYWGCEYFRWKSASWEDIIFVCRWDDLLEIPEWHIEEKESTKTGKQFLFITHNSGSDEETYSLFDLENMNFVFKKADYFDFGNHDTISHNISYTNLLPREWIKKHIFWKNKEVTHQINLSE